MRRLIYSMGVSLDGFIADRNGGIGFSAPDEELHRFHNQQAREVGAQLYGRRLYETMRAWETADQDPSASAAVLEFAGIWKDTPKLVFSTTLEGVGSEYRLIGEDTVDEVTRLKAQDGKDLAVGGAGLASSLIRLGLVDEYRPFINPVVLGGGTPYLPDLDEPLDLELLETRAFSSGVVYARYRQRSPER